jgi:hypothetical protein
MKSAADIIALIERRAEEYRKATAEVASCGLAYVEAPRYSPARKAYYKALCAQINARGRLEIQCESLAFASDPLVAVAYLDAALRNADLAHQIAEAEGRARRQKGVA